MSGRAPTPCADQEFNCTCADVRRKRKGGLPRAVLDQLSLYLNDSPDAGQILLWIKLGETRTAPTRQPCPVGGFPVGDARHPLQRKISPSKRLVPHSPPKGQSRPIKVDQGSCVNRSKPLNSPKPHDFECVTCKNISAARGAIGRRLSTAGCEHGRFHNDDPAAGLQRRRWIGKGRRSVYGKPES
jgi:hypothetical protein